MMPSRLRHRAGRAEARENRLSKIMETRAGSYSDTFIGYFGNA